MRAVLTKYIPENSIDLTCQLIEKHPIHIKVVASRKTKHGDFRVINHTTEITINNNLNSYHFLLTLIHEIAHFVTYKEYGHKVKPHGIEWKKNFQHLMLPFLSPNIFPVELLPYLAKYLKNPKASTGSDTYLMKMLNQYNEKSNDNYIFELEKGAIFVFRERVFKLGNKKRTRYECIEIATKKLYLINQNTLVKKQ